MNNFVFAHALVSLHEYLIFMNYDLPEGVNKLASEEITSVQKL